MFGLWKIERKPATPAEEKLDRIKEILFPPNKLEEEIDPKTGEPFKWQIDYSVDMNLDAVLIDLQDGNNDPAVHNTLKNITKRLMEVRELLEAYMELNPEAKYIMVESSRDTDHVENI
jgi:hypothetical protein